jgi:chromosome segregation ATPase
MTKQEYDAKNMTYEKKLIQNWCQVQAEVKKYELDSDFSLNIYVFTEYRKFSEKIRNVLSDPEAVEGMTLEEVNELILAFDRRNYQKFMQTMRYINEIRHNKLRLSIMPHDGRRV